MAILFYDFRHTTTPPLCISWTNDLLVAGCNDKTIRLIDPRSESHRHFGNQKYLKEFFYNKTYNKTLL